MRNGLFWLFCVLHILIVAVTVDGYTLTDITSLYSLYHDFANEEGGKLCHGIEIVALKLVCFDESLFL